MLAAISRRVLGLGRGRFDARRYQADVHDLRLSVHRTMNGWNVCVRNSEEDTLYSGTRHSLDEAKLVGIEFAVLRMTGALEAGIVQIVAQNLPWDEN